MNMAASFCKIWLVGGKEKEMANQKIIKSSFLHPVTTTLPLSDDNSLLGVQLRHSAPSVLPACLSFTCNI